MSIPGLKLGDIELGNPDARGKHSLVPTSTESQRASRVSATDDVDDVSRNSVSAADSNIDIITEQPDTYKREEVASMLEPSVAARSRSVCSYFVSPCPFWITALSIVAGIALLVSLIIVVLSKSSSSNVAVSSFKSSLSVNMTNALLSWRDTSADPCEDFHQYACGGYIRNVNKRSAFELTSLGRSKQIIRILKENYPLVSTFYLSCMDTSLLKSSSFPLEYELTAINNAQNVSDLLQVLGSLQLYGLASESILFSLILPDFFTASQNVASIFLSAIPNVTPTMIVGAPVFTIAPFFNYTAAQALNASKEVSKLHLGIASLLGSSPYPAGYNTFTVSNFTTQTNHVFNKYLQARFPAINQSSLLNANIDQLNLLAASSSSFSLSTIKDYIKLDMYIKTKGFLNTQDPIERESVCSKMTVQLFPDLVAHLWVVEDFNPSVDKLNYIQNLLDIMLNGAKIVLESNKWMDRETLQAALLKFSQIQKNVAIPRAWQLIDVSITGHNPALDYKTISKWNNMKQANKLSKPVDRSEFVGLVSDANAVYSPNYNSINLYAGLLVDPMFNAAWPDLINIATYGFVMGHEIFHGFDNTGHKFDGLGAYRNWFTPASDEAYANRSQCLVAQYNAFTLTDGTTKYPVDGQLTLGENIADHGGLHAAWLAYKQVYGADGGSPLLAAETGISNDQLFFLRMAQTWCTAQELFIGSTDTHSPDKFRVNGPMSNFPAFASAYQCRASSTMGRSLTSNRCDLF